METWSEARVLGLLVEEGLVGVVEVLCNGRQLAAMTRAQCCAAVVPGNDADQAGARLFAAIQRAKASGGVAKPVPSSTMANGASAGDYVLLETQLFADELGGDEDDDVPDLDDEDSEHKFPALLEFPGGRSVAVMAAVVVATVLCCTVFADRLAGVAGLERGEWIRQFLQYESIPVLLVPFTYCHIYAALAATFFPLEFRGCLQIPGTNMGLGWQGIVPFSVVRMAKLAVKMLTAKLLQVDEVFNRLDVLKVASLLEPEIKRKTTVVIDAVAEAEAPRLWRMLPSALRAQVSRQAAAESPKVIGDILKEIQENVDYCFDLEDLVVTMMSENVALSNSLFISCSDRELAFIRNSGAWMGGVFGVLQMLLTIYYKGQAYWMLPVVGFVLGAVTNWLALFAIFNPVEPIPLCCGRLRLHGLFLTRQRAVSALYGRIVRTKILTAANLNKALMETGPRSERVREIARRHILASFERSVAPLRQLPTSMQPPLDSIGQKLAQELAEGMYETMRGAEDYMDEAFDLERTLKSRMAALPSSEFASLLRPIFEQDEWKLVLTGGVLGAFFGGVQYAFLGF